MRFFFFWGFTFSWLLWCLRKNFWFFFNRSPFFNNELFYRYTHFFLKLASCFHSTRGCPFHFFHFSCLFLLLIIFFCHKGWDNSYELNNTSHLSSYLLRRKGSFIFLNRENMYHDRIYKRKNKRLKFLDISMRRGDECW